MLSFLLLASCSEEYPEKDFRPGPNGEPPKALSYAYSGKFVATQRNYVKVLGDIHAFLIDNKFQTNYTGCFNFVLDIRKTSPLLGQKSVFPCVALMSEQGAPTKTYLSVTVEQTWFNQLDKDNRFEYSISIYGTESMAKEFKFSVEPKLIALYSDSEVAAHNNSNQQVPSAGTR